VGGGLAAQHSLSPQKNYEEKKIKMEREARCKLYKKRKKLHRSRNIPTKKKEKSLQKLSS
jgi:hypothetical protein